MYAKRNLQMYANKLVVTFADCSKQTVNQNTNVAGEVCKVAQKRMFSLTVMRCTVPLMEN